ncbi:MAG: PEP-CTERM sorting domain-containing protein, partial [Duganella sp.]
GAGGGFDLFELTISNHGVQLYSHAFLTGAEADLFFNGSLLDLGPLGGGMQDLLISSTLNYSGPGGYAFNYLVGTGIGVGTGTGGGIGNGVTAVPEASTWLMMVIGMGGMLLVARRRAGPAARA